MKNIFCSVHKLTEQHGYKYLS